MCFYLTYVPRLRIYIAGPYAPYSASPHEATRITNNNIFKAIKYSEEVTKKGHLPYISYYSHFMVLNSEKSWPYNSYVERDILCLEVCDGLLYYNHKIGESPSADKELRIAIERGMPVFFDVEDIPVVKLSFDKNLGDFSVEGIREAKELEHF